MIKGGGTFKEPDKDETVNVLVGDGGSGGGKVIGLPLVFLWLHWPFRSRDHKRGGWNQLVISSDGDEEKGKREKESKEGEREEKGKQASKNSKG